MEKVTYNYNDLKRLIQFKYGSLKKFSREVLGISDNQFSKILNNKAQYSVPLIEKTIQALGLSLEEVGLYFFTHELHKIA